MAAIRICDSAKLALVLMIVERREDLRRLLAASGVSGTTSLMLQVQIFNAVKNFVFNQNIFKAPNSNKFRLERICRVIICFDEIYSFLNIGV